LNQQFCFNFYGGDFVTCYWSNLVLLGWGLTQGPWFSWVPYDLCNDLVKLPLFPKCYLSIGCLLRLIPVVAGCLKAQRLPRCPRRLSFWNKLLLNLLQYCWTLYFMHKSYKLYKMFTLLSISNTWNSNTSIQVEGWQASPS
jgi:hypothetical protein